ncbi:MAG: TIGR02530 family flagellar biosynthesis protein [Bacteriovoracaceae bacterium]|nr:TIGR02530 family flagellar biosynthesis protein [Bacteriovoracaceae bacterium]
MINTELQSILSSYKSGDLKRPGGPGSTGSNSAARGAEKLDKLKSAEELGKPKEVSFEEVLKGNSKEVPLEAKVAAKNGDSDLLISQHAIKRMTERNITLDAEEFTKLKSALQKLRTKGGQDSLVITNKAAYILDVGNNKVVTAMDKQSLNDNVFTKIDSTLIL